MDLMAGKDAELQQEGSCKPMNYQNLPTPSMASMENMVMDLSAPMIDSFGVESFVWQHRLDASNFGYSDMNFHNAGTSPGSPSIRADLGLHQDLVLGKNISQLSFPSLVSQTVPHLPTDSDFIERAARLSSFRGSCAQWLSPLPLAHSMNPFALKAETGMQSQRDEHNVAEDGRLLKNTRECRSFMNPFREARSRVSGNESGDTEYSQEGKPEDLTPKGLHSKKRKKPSEQQDEESEGGKENEDTKPKGDSNLTTANASGGNHAKAHGSDLPKEGYVHVRARRGQATNSHSLAERVRREKISERMKFLQDLVPGCNKVTGKAVMLDEIINYVQSLQRQVELLSLKLAAVYPHLEFNLEQYSTTDGFQSRPGAVPFPAPLHPPQHGFMQMGSSSIIIRRPMNLPPGEPAPQVPDVWEGELHNMVHMGKM